MTKFKQIKSKNLYKFATFDIKEYAINFAEQHTGISEKDKAIYSTLENIYFSMTSTFGSKRKEGYLISPWEHSMEQRFVKQLVIFFFINFQKIIIKKMLFYTETMD